MIYENFVKLDVTLIFKLSKSLKALKPIILFLNLPEP